LYEILTNICSGFCFTLYLLFQNQSFPDFSRILHRTIREEVTQIYRKKTTSLIRILVRKNKDPIEILEGLSSDFVQRIIFRIMRRFKIDSAQDPSKNE
jgi:hypothetical protein